jgi:hypothetical protein
MEIILRIALSQGSEVTSQRPEITDWRAANGRSEGYSNLLKVRLKGYDFAQMFVYRVVFVRALNLSGNPISRTGCEQGSEKEPWVVWNYLEIA